MAAFGGFRGFEPVAALAGIMLAGPLAATSIAADEYRAPDPVTTARAVAVIDGDTITLDTGAHLRLTGIQAPKLALGRPGFRPWPLAEEAKTALSRLALGKRLSLDYGGRRIDRWGRLLAQARADGTWLQAKMLALGMARVYTFADNRARAAELYAAEREARAAGLGIWALAWYRIRAPGETGRHIGSFQLVEGRVVSAAVVRGRGYLNFGPDWKTDFTVSVAPRHMRTFRNAGVDLRDLEGNFIRVRGWLVRRNGAMIGATHPEQIERLDR